MNENKAGNLDEKTVLWVVQVKPTCYLKMVTLHIPKISVK